MDTEGDQREIYATMSGKAPDSDPHKSEEPVPKNFAANESRSHLIDS